MTKKPRELFGWNLCGQTVPPRRSKKPADLPWFLRRLAAIYSEPADPKAECPPWFRFSLARLLLVLIVLSLLLVLNTRNPPKIQPGMAVAAFSFSLLVLIFHPARVRRISRTGRIACTILLALAVLIHPFPGVLLLAAFPFACCATDPISVSLLVPLNVYLWSYGLSRLWKGAEPNPPTIPVDAIILSEESSKDDETRDSEE